MLEAIISGTIQGIAEWLPISSEGLLTLVKINFFNNNNLDIIIKQALFLHLGTFLAALIYFRKDVIHLVKLENKKILKFLIISTIISGGLGFLFLLFISSLQNYLALSAKIITLIIGLLLLITGYLQIKAKNIKNLKNKDNINNTDSILLGILQGCAVLPGLSRSGLTVAGLLLRKFDETLALKLSFLMSLPIVLFGNIFLNLDKIILSKYNLIALFFSFIFGLITIDLLLRLAKKINFGYFALIFGIITIIAAAV